MQVLKAPIKNILLIDDDKDDCFVFEKALLEIHPSIKLKCLTESDEIFEEMAHQLPDLIFLDLNMPVKTGYDCLKELQEHTVYRKVPVIIYSGSDYILDINVTYGLGATLYFTKPNTVPALVNSLKQILDMAWARPTDITSDHFTGEGYVPFQLA